MTRNQCRQLEEEVLAAYAGIAWAPLRQEAVSHTLRVIDAITLLETETGLYERRAAAALHDWGRFILNSPRHAAASANEAASRLPDHPRIAQAIRHHSDKDHIHDPLSEDLKDADVLARWLEDPEGCSHPRLQAALQRLKSR